MAEPALTKTTSIGSMSAVPSHRETTHKMDDIVAKSSTPSRKPPDASSSLSSHMKSPLPIGDAIETPDDLEGSLMAVFAEPIKTNLDRLPPATATRKRKQSGGRGSRGAGQRKKLHVNRGDTVHSRAAGSHTTNADEDGSCTMPEEANIQTENLMNKDPVKPPSPPRLSRTTTRSSTNGSQVTKPMSKATRDISSVGSLDIADSIEVAHHQNKEDLVRRGLSLTSADSGYSTITILTPRDSHERTLERGSHKPTLGTATPKDSAIGGLPADDGEADAVVDALPTETRVDDIQFFARVGTGSGTMDVAIPQDHFANIKTLTNCLRQYSTWKQIAESGTSVSFEAFCSIYMMGRARK